MKSSASLLLLFLNAVVPSEARAAGGVDAYKILETSYGPSIRQRDWSAEGAKLDASGGALKISSPGGSRVSWTHYPLGGGGDITTAIRFQFVKWERDSEFVINYQCPKSDPTRKGLRLVFGGDGVRLFQQSQKLAERKFSGREMSEAHAVKFISLGTAFHVDLDGSKLAQGEEEPTAAENKVHVFFDLEQCDVRMDSFAEEFIAHDVVFPRWQRKELLYEETFGPDSLRDRWVVVGQTPQSGEGSFTFRRTSIALLRPRFAGPIAIESVATPLVTNAGHKFEGRVSDAIFLWMVDRPGGGLPEYIGGLKNASLEHFNSLPFYWMDFGGTDNQTTRLRRSPNRQLVRQFVDPPRLLQKPGTTYKITTVQNGSFIEFWVNDKPWIQFFDPQPHRSGHVGYRGFIGDLKITGIKVWRIEPAAPATRR